MLDLFRGSLSARRVVLLLSALPEQSNTRKRMEQDAENARQRALLDGYRRQQARKQRRLRVVA